MAKQVILYLAANPEGLATLRLDDEASAIEKVLGSGTHRDHFQFETRWSAQPIDLIVELRRLRPTVVHFSGHSDGRGLFFKAADGQIHAVSNAALGQAFEALGGSVRLVVLNACWSDATAAVLAPHVDCVVGMAGEVTDEAALTFSTAFYGALGDGASVQDAYHSARVAVPVVRDVQDVSKMRQRRDGPVALVDGSQPAIAPRSIRQPSAFSGTTLGARIVELLQKVPGTASFGVRSKMIPALSQPGGTPLVLDRDRDSARIDFELIIAQLENLGLPLVEEMLYGCAERVAIPGLHEQLSEAARQVRSYFEGARGRARKPEAAPGGRPFQVSLVDPPPDGTLALDHLFEGNNASPGIAWVNPPEGTESFTVLMEELDLAPGEARYYWVQHSIPGDVTELPRNAGGLDSNLLGVGSPARSDVGSLAGYHGPASTPRPHRYELSLLALSRADLPEDPMLSAKQLLTWIHTRECLLARAKTVISSVSPFSHRDFLFKGHAILGRIFGARAWQVFCVFLALALVLLMLPAWLIHVDDLSPAGWTAPGGHFSGVPPRDNRGFFHQLNWWPIYLLAVPAFFAAAAWFAAQLRVAVQRIAWCPGGVISGVRELAFAKFVQLELARSARRTRWVALAFALAINLIDTLPLITAYCTEDFSRIRPYWGIAHLHARHVDFAQNVAFDIVAYLFQTTFTFLFAFITFKFLSFLRVLSRTVRGRHNAHGYVFAPSWRDPEQRLGLSALGPAYNAFILLALAVLLFAFLHRIQQLSEIGDGWPGYWADLSSVLRGEAPLLQLYALGRWSTMTTGIIAMLVALVIPLGVIAYFPLYQLRRFLRQQITSENDVFALKLRLAKTEAERNDLVTRHATLRRISVWPNGDAVAYGSLSLWLVLFGAAIYPPVVLVGGSVVGVGGIWGMVRKVLFPSSSA